MDSKPKATKKQSSQNPFYGANTTEERELVWAELKKIAKPISKVEFLERIEKKGAGH